MPPKGDPRLLRGCARGERRDQRSAGRRREPQQILHRARPSFQFGFRSIWAEHTERSVERCRQIALLVEAHRVGEGPELQDRQRVHGRPLREPFARRTGSPLGKGIGAVPEPREGGIDAGRVGLEPPARLTRGRQRVVRGSCPAVQPHRPHQHVGVDPRRIPLAEDLRHAPLGDASEQLELQPTIARCHEPLGPERVGCVEGVDMDDAVAVPHDVHRPGKAGDLAAVVDGHGGPEGTGRGGRVGGLGGGPDADGLLARGEDRGDGQERGGGDEQATVSHVPKLPPPEGNS